MVFLFRSGTVREKLWLVYKATRQHASNLARFAVLFKGTCLLLKNMNGGKEDSVHTFLAGLFGGYWVFGHGKGASSSVNQQIVIYVFARVVLALAKLAVQSPESNTLVGSSYGQHGGKGLLSLTREQQDAVRQYSWPVFASLSWAGVMWLFRWYPETLQPSLRSSMTYMYVLSPFLFLDLASSWTAVLFLWRRDRLTSTFSYVDTRMRRSGMVHEISYYITNRPTRWRQIMHWDRIYSCI
jgi:peroxisomal membrane protein 4